MKFKFLVIVFVLAITTAEAQKAKGKSSSSTPTNWGLGLRLGDPSGVTAKKYLGNQKAFEFNIGRSSYWGYDYRDRFFNDDKFNNFDYVGYKRNGSVSIQAHLLFQKDIPGAKNLQWYWGFGPQIRFNTFSYTYRYDGGNNWIYVTEKVTDVDLGADVVLGLEYHIPNAPLSVFADLNLLIEIVDDPLAVFGQGGVGIRYNF